MISIKHVTLSGGSVYSVTVWEPLYFALLFNINLFAFPASVCSSQCSQTSTKLSVKEKISTSAHTHLHRGSKQGDWCPAGNQHCHNECVCVSILVIMGEWVKLLRASFGSCTLCTACVGLMLFGSSCLTILIHINLKLCDFLKVTSAFTSNKSPLWLLVVKDGSAAGTLNDPAQECVMLRVPAIQSRQYSLCGPY